jgi:hypothetical protein
VLGFPIRTSADQSPIDGSPQLFAVIHVLHRFLAPRHPPLALCSLEEQRCSCLLCSSQRASPASGSSLSCDSNAHRARRGSGAEARAMREGTDVGPAPSKRKRRQSVSIRHRGEDGSYDSRVRVDLPTSAPTGNWFEPGWTNANHRLNSAP